MGARVPPSADGEQLVPLAKYGQELLEHLDSVTQSKAQICAVDKSNTTPVDGTFMGSGTIGGMLVVAVSWQGRTLLHRIEANRSALIARCPYIGAESICKVEPGEEREAC